MKKLSARGIIISAVLAISITACGKAENTPDNAEPATSQEQSTKDTDAQAITPVESITPANGWYSDDCTYDYVLSYDENTKLGIYFPTDMEVDKEKSQDRTVTVTYKDPEYNDSHEIFNVSLRKSESCLSEYPTVIPQERIINTPLGDFKTAIVDREEWFDSLIAYKDDDEIAIVVSENGYYIDGEFYTRYESIHYDYPQFVCSIFDKDSPAKIDYDEHFISFETTETYEKWMAKEDNTTENDIAISEENNNDQTSPTEDSSPETKESANSNCGYILLADGTKIMPGGTIKLSDMESAVFVVDTGNSEDVWYCTILCVGPYYMAEDPEVNCAWEGETS